VKIWISRATSKVSDGVYREETDSKEKQEGNIRVMYQFHETTPLKVAEVPKSKPELEVLETVLTCTIR
jgi:hypothetical protein